MTHEVRGTLQHARPLVPPQQFDVTTTPLRQLVHRVWVSGEGAVQPPVAAVRKQRTRELMQHGKSGVWGF